jgi:hypothetical protein
MQLSTALRITVKMKLLFFCRGSEPNTIQFGYKVFQRTSRKQERVSPRRILPFRIWYEAIFY